MRRGLSVLRKVLTILPVVQANQGIKVAELSRITGIPEREILTDLPKLVNLCGIPPYSPADLVDLEIEGDRVTIRFAEQFRRPVRLTMSEALALELALAGWEEEVEGPFAKAVASMRAKVRAAAGPEVAEELSQAADRISAVAGPGRASGRIAVLKRALQRQMELRIVYFSNSRGTLGDRLLRAFGIYERSGHYYVVGWCDPPGRVITLRADRIRAVEWTEKDYEIPDDFTISDFLVPAPPQPVGEASVVRIRFDPDRARFARELFPAREGEDLEDGSWLATVRTGGVFWLVSEVLSWGGGAEVLEPEEVKREVVARAAAALDRYGERD